jgi:small redox-active disulfide protein 2
MKIEILGTGCPKCKKTEQNVRKAVDQLGLKADIIKVEDIEEIINRGVMITPTVFIDGEEKISGRIPTPYEIIDLLQK